MKISTHGNFDGHKTFKVEFHVYESYRPVVDIIGMSEFISLMREILEKNTKGKVHHLDSVNSYEDGINISFITFESSFTSLEPIEAICRSSFNEVLGLVKNYLKIGKLADVYSDAEDKLMKPYKP